MTDNGMKADDFLRRAAAEMADRAASRDAESTGERSMDRTVQAFWLIYGDAILARGYMTETEGWEFVSILKKRRGAQGEYREDDFIDDVAYAALAAEAASKAKHGTVALADKLTRKVEARARAKGVDWDNPQERERWLHGRTRA